MDLAREGARPAVQKLDEEMRQTLVDNVETLPTFSLLQISAELRVRLPAKPEVSITTISSSLDGQLISLKTLESVAEDRNSVRIKHDRRDFANWVMAHGVQTNMIYLDEAGFYLFTRRTKRRTRVS